VQPHAAATAMPHPEYYGAIYSGDGILEADSSTSTVEPVESQSRTREAFAS